MSAPWSSRREFLFLQGPPGPFFRQLAAALSARDCGIHRINLSGGDRYDWPDAALNYRGRQRDWPMFLDRYLRTHGITDLVLFGDCRPMHQMALRMAQLRRIHIHVFEEGYIRPDWMTLERDGVNGHSPMERDPDAILAAAQQLPPIPKRPPITADFKRRARDSYWHYHHVVTGRLRFPFYRTHRQGSLILEGIGWLWRLAMRERRQRQAAETLATIATRDFFIFPLQLTGDYQIRHHSPFGSMRVAVDYVLESFAHFAPAETVLLVKEHPLDSGYTNWRSLLLKRARELGVSGRIHHIDGGDLDALCQAAQGMVCVNSTSATLALEAGTPVAVLGDAIYDIAGITHGGGLDSFWTRPTPPNAQLYAAFKRVLHAKCLVRGGLASESATTELVRNSVDRLLADETRPIRQFEPARVVRAVG